MADSEHPFQESSPAAAFKLFLYSPAEQGQLLIARHEAFLETGGTRACEQVEIIEVRDLVDEGVEIACKGHPARS